MKYYRMHYPSPIGDLQITSNTVNILELILSCQTTRYPDAKENKDLPVLQAAYAWLGDYFSGKRPDPRVIPVQAYGTEFQKMIWERLCRIPYGQTVTYGEIAKEIAAARKIERVSAQAVGQAVGANAISIIVPCHRVLSSNGKLTGYAGGIENKAWLLDHEQK